jgi:hypothetical protein
MQHVQMCTWTGQCILDDCDQACVANTKSASILTPIWVLASQKLAVPLICTAAASAVYDRLSLPVEEMAGELGSQATRKRVLLENVRVYQCL